MVKREIEKDDFSVHSYSTGNDVDPWRRSGDGFQGGKEGYGSGLAV
jgi:hypothetical protein